MEYRQDPVPQSEYQTRLAEETLEDLNSEKPENAPPDDASIRYWSDYNRVYYAPRTIQRLPDPADWETVDGDWAAGKEAFTRHNMVRNQLMQGACGITELTAG